MKKATFFVALVLVLGLSLQVYASVSLEDFNGVWDGNSNRVTLEFSTGSEIDHAAFNVWRSTANIPPEEVNTTNSIKLTSSPIMSGSACTAAGEDYTYEDSTVSATEDVYFYYLESLPCGSSNSEFYGALDQVDSGLQVVNPNVPFDIHYYAPLIRVLE